MITLVPDSPPPRRGLFWRVLHLVAGFALFACALRMLPPMPAQPVALALIAALLGAGAMGITDSLVGLVAAWFDKTQKGADQ